MADKIRLAWDNGDVVAAPPAGPDTPESTCPLTALGHRDGEFVFLDIKGQERRLKARALSSRGDLVGLFLGDTAWLFRWFPHVKKTVVKRDGVETVTEDIVGFAVAQASETLMTMCGAAGLFGSHVVLRGPGVWAGADGAPVVHCGDRVLTGGAWQRSGYRAGDEVWQSSPRTPRPGAMLAETPLRPGEPGFAAPAQVARQIQELIRSLWKFRHDGSDIVAIGLMGIGYYGAAATWRSNGYLIGGTGSGKSYLLDLLRACVPVHTHSTDTSKAGIEGAINGQPSIAFLDEAGDRADQHGAQALLDMVLSASRGEGTRGLRGSADGKSRTFQVICSVIMAAKNPPDMQQQHRDRFTIVEMVKPRAGDDNRVAMEAAAEFAHKHARALWGRALEAWPRWLAALAAFRAALAVALCAPREMDQVGAILASWWVLCHDGVPSDDAAADSVRDVAAFVRSAAEIERDDGPRRLVQYLAGITVQRDRSTDIEQLGVLVEKAFSRDAAEDLYARKLLERYGVRVVLAEEITDRQNRPVPRGGQSDGMWFACNAETLRALFRGSPFEGDRWRYELMRHDSAVASKARTIRIGGYAGPAIWLARRDWDPPDDEL